ncbi:ribonuclease HII [Elizabethkingia anophelis]|uniref:ribonuclease HII n=1 Tax=Elizabethkingia anophelis TaxID=1117645 RepID=UPI00041E978D|nr:ribonuclease HII [Elizabethkingia anophelis]MCT3746572.1 ribonuclease HII [Elizabethkingia anophelis]MCT3942344.1 ribonuclease HII [Elizabethkingia anophelis]MCT4195044.1 ribonuclease HII [Elizabethkingia anophelis]MDC8027978.1 ribonuclease HII [Elizabethkingia anophelis]MDV3491708.1 ribonuclease HII [Elizabethkingia anophelis]
MNMITKWQNKYTEAGCDEVGRGCLAGPVVAASVILDEKFNNFLVKDSKTLSKTSIKELAEYIKINARDYAIAELPPEFIDKHNILNASIHAMHLALDQLKVRPEFILVDGNRFHPYNYIPHQCVVKGDSKVLSIAAASILAKDYRDRLMEKLHEEYPQYGWAKNVGYPTKAHRDAIREFGTTPYHRMSFKLL